MFWLCIAWEDSAAGSNHLEAGDKPGWSGCSSWQTSDSDWCWHGWISCHQSTATAAGLLAVVAVLAVMIIDCHNQCHCIRFSKQEKLNCNWIVIFKNLAVVRSEVMQMFIL